MTRDADSTADLPTLQSADALEAVPGFTLIRVLAESTIARAYECRAERNGEIVVVKVLTKEFAADRQAVNRMLRESRVIAGLRAHPNIARIVDVGEAAAGPYAAVERLQGTDLRARLVKTGRLPVGQALAAVRDAARAVEAASAVGVAHRDIKPSNLFLSPDGTVKLLDFGFAAPLSRLGGPEGVYGTPAFIAPELVRGAPADVRTDIYALGATLFQLVTARPLFEGATADVLAAHQKKQVPSIATMVPDAGIAVVDILYRLLHKDPARRPQTAAEVVKLLDDAAARAQRTSTGSPMPGVGAAPAPSEPQWPTLASPTGATVVAPRPALANAATVVSTTVQANRRETAVPPQVSSPFDSPSMEQEASSPYNAAPTGVMGTLKQMSVTEIIQMLEIGKKSARIDVSDMANLKGVVHVHDGQLVRCTADALVGEPAVVLLCQKKEGFFRIHYEKEPCEKNITRPTTFVLLEAMRQIDETASQPPAPGPASAPPTSMPRSGAPTPPKPTRAPTPMPSKQPLPSLAKPRLPAPSEGPAAVWPQPPPMQRAEATQAGKPKPVSGLGDGIDFSGDGSSGKHEKLADVSSVDDVTLREPSVQKPALDVAKQKAQAAWRTVQPGLARAWATMQREAPRALAKAHAAVEPLRPQLARVHPKLGAVSPLLLLAAAAGLLLVIGIGLGAAMSQPRVTLGYDEGLRQVLGGRGHDVIAALGRVPHAERSAEQSLVLADAYAVRGDDDRALALYGASFPAATDPLELGFLLGRLDASAPDDEIDMLVLWPDNVVEDLLLPQTLDVRTHRRDNAVAILVERGALAKIDVEAVALLGLMPREGTCGTRRPAMHALEAAGKSKAALDAVQRIGNAADACFKTDEIASAYKAIKKRM